MGFIKYDNNNNNLLMIEIRLIIIIIWTKEELRQIDQRTRKLITMHKALHPRDDKDRLCVSRKEGGRGLANIEDCVETTIQQLEEYTKKKGQRQITYGGQQ